MSEDNNKNQANDTYLSGGGLDKVLADHAVTESFKEKHKDELSGARYARKKMYELAVTVGGIAGGALLGRLLSKLKIKLPFGGGGIAGASSPPASEEALKQQVAKEGLFTGIGAFAGAMVSGIVLAYEHWVRTESVKIAVQEINDDISNLKFRRRTDDELIKENNRLREMLEVETAKTEQLQHMCAGSGEKEEEKHHHHKHHHKQRDKHMRAQPHTTVESDNIEHDGIASAAHSVVEQQAAGKA